NEIDPQAASELLGRYGSVVDRHFLGGALVGHVVGPLATIDVVPDANAVDHQPRVAGAAAMHRHESVLQVVRPADIHQNTSGCALAGAESGDENRLIEVAAPRWEGVDNLFGQHPLLRRALNVDNWCF